MKKKVITYSNILYYLLYGVLCLLVLNTLSTTSYARTLTATEIMNFALNGYVYKKNSIPSQTIIDNVKSHEQDFEIWAELTETYEGQYGLAHYGDDFAFFYYYGSQANLNSHSAYYYSNSINVNSSYLTRKRAYFNISNNTFGSFSNGDLGIGSSNRFLYVDFNVKSNANNAYPSGANLYTAGTCLPDNSIFAENFVSSDKFEFSPTLTNFEICSINGLAQPSEVYVYDRNNQDYLTLGYLEKFSNLDNITISRYRYTKANGWVETNVNAFNDFSGYNVQDDILTYTIDVSKISADTLVIFNFTPNNIVDFSNQVFALYVKSPFTYISNGVIYPAQTFSGDYYNNYNDNTNTDKIVDNNQNDTENVTDTLTDDSQVDSMLSEFISGDANDLANRLGYSGIENPFVATIKNVVESTADVLLGSGNVTLDISFYGHQIILHSEDFVLPSNPVVILIHLICNGFFIWGLYKYGFKLYQYINTGRIKKVIDETDSDKYYFF